MVLDSLTWGPKYWFFLHTIALQYSLHPNDTIKKIYFNFIQNLPLMIPDEEMAKNFSKLLNDYPVTPYLDSRESFSKWMHMIHNKINMSLNKPTLNYEEAIINYFNNYKSKKKINKEDLRRREKLIYFLILILLLIIITVIYMKC